MAVLSANGTYVTVESGDTLSQIALDHGNGKTYQQLAAINDIPNPDLIYIGQRINLSGEGSSKSSSSSFVASIKQFGVQADLDSSLLATWAWDKSDTKEYKIQWQYYTADKVWFVGVDETTTHKYSTYSIPSNAKKVRFRVKPIANTKKGKEIWTAIWSGWKTHTVVYVPATPSAPSVTLSDFKLTVEVRNLTDSPSEIKFEIVKDDATVCKTGKAKVTTGTASYSCTITAGSKYKARCCALKDGVYGEWSGYSNNVDTLPAVPSKFTKCEPRSLQDPISIYLEWSAVTNATSYDIQYATSKSYFDVSDQVYEVTGITNTSREITSNIVKEREFFFRIRANNANGSSGWSEVSSTLIGSGPAAPTTWSSTTTAVVGEPLTLYWVHNSEDGSIQSYAELELTIDGVKTYQITSKSDSTEETYTVKNLLTNETTTNKVEYESASDAAKTKSYEINTSGYPTGSRIEWRVRTSGISKTYGDWSISRVVDIYAPPTLELTVSNLVGTSSKTLQSFPFTVTALAGPSTQRPTGYHLAIIANEFYETVDNLGNPKTVNAGEQVYSKYFDISEMLNVTISAGDLSLENGIPYTITCTVSMNTGLTAEDSEEFTVDWTFEEYSLNAEIGVDQESFAANIRPYCVIYESIYHKVNMDPVSGIFTVTDDVINGVYGTALYSWTTTTGEQVCYGTTASGETTYYCSVEVETTYNNVLLAVYRREFDGSFTELATGLDSAKNTTITDPHPALDYARYRIVATSKTTGRVSYTDLPGYLVGGKAAVIQWDEEWTTYNTFGNEDELEQPSWSGSLLQLPYNLDVSDKRDMDVAFVGYIGRSHPVSYYGTQVGETSTWSVEVDKEDRETLYALRRLSVWKGNAYVREPSGSGYWANVKVSFSQKHCEVTIPVTLDITRVEGGM